MDVLTPIQSYKVPVITLDRSVPKESVCQVFENVNTGGMALTVFELVTATFAADDFERSGDVLCEIKVPSDPGERICRYPEESIPERYSGLPVVGLTTRVTGPAVHNAWAVVANIADHRVLFALAALRRLERNR